MTKKILDIVGLGEAMVEFNEQSDGRFAVSCGGDTSNCVIAAARLGARTGYVSRLGADSFAAILRKQWALDGVNASNVAEDADAPTGLYFVTHGESGHEFIYRRSGSAASFMQKADLPLDYIESAKILHVSGISQAISTSAAETVVAAMTHAKAAGVLVSYDTNLRLKLWSLKRARNIIHDAISLADIARPSVDDAHLLTGLSQPDAIVDFYLKMGAGLVALTLGAKGALVATPDRREFIASIPVKSVDATGAGDTFGGAFLARLAAGDDAFTAARFANIAAALSTTKFGAVNSFPTLSEVDDLIRALG